MIKLISVLVISFLIVYSLLNKVLEFINKREIEKICDKKISRILVSTISSFLLVLLYIKYYNNFNFIKYFILMLYLILTGYIDAHSSYVYTFLSHIFLGIGLIFLGISVIHYKADFKLYFISIICTLFISLLFVVFKGFASGDLEVFIIVAIYIGGIISSLNVFLALSVAGIGTIIKLLLRKIKLSDQGTLCQYIAVSTYMILLFM